MSDGFYRACEDRHRGTLESVKSRQRVYLPLIAPLARHYPNAAAIDLGCGRGEWLELLSESGFDALGIDLDDGMLAECRARGLHVRTQDAISALQGLPDASQAIVSGMHLAEHIPFEALQLLVQEALRVLLPAGLLILETPNPENIVVGTANFYLDPTHNRPLPPLLLSFLPEYYGFPRVKILRLQEPVSLAQTRRFTLHDVLGGVSPDYAVVAQKSADASLLALVSHALDRDYGVSLGDLSNAYAGQLERGWDEVQQSIVELDRNINRSLNHKTDTLDIKINELDVRLNLALQRVDRDLGIRANALESRTGRLEKLSVVIQMGRQYRLLRAEGLGARCRKITSKTVRFVASRGARVISAFPRLKRLLIGIAQKLGVYGLLQSRLRPPPAPAPGENALGSASSGEVKKILEDLPAEVRETFGALDAEIKRREKK